MYQTIMILFDDLRRPIYLYLDLQDGYRGGFYRGVNGAGAGFAKPAPLPSLENFTSFKKLVIFIHDKKSSNNSKF